MVLSQTTNQRERDKFVLDSEENTATRTKLDPGQVITLTPPAAIAGFATEAKQDTGNVYLAPLTTWVTTALTLIASDTAYLIPASEQSDRRVVVIYNISDTAVYIGDSSVTTSIGILLPAGGTMTLDSESGLYAICGNSGKIINVFEGK